jgi:hypothetical protein
MGMSTNEPFDSTVMFSENPTLAGTMTPGGGMPPGAFPLRATLTNVFHPSGTRAPTMLNEAALNSMWPPERFEAMRVEEVIGGLEEGPLRVECHDRDPKGSLTDEMILGEQGVIEAKIKAAAEAKAAAAKAKADAEAAWAAGWKLLLFSLLHC